MNLANEVSSMETELVSLRSEIDILRKHQGLAEFENEQLRRALAKCQSERDNYMRRAEAIKSLLDQTGASLVNSIRKYHESERELQEDALGVGDDDRPKFLTNGERVVTMPENVFG